MTEKPKKDMKLLTVVLFLTSLIFVASFAAISFSFFSSAYGQSTGDTFDRDKALSFLMSLLTNYNQDKWLCMEYNGSDNYWVYNDNALAFQILSYEGNRTNNSTLLEAAEKIERTIEDTYNFSLMEGNDRIEVMFNQSITFPRYTSTGYSFSPVIDHDMQLGPNLVNNPSVEFGTTYPDLWYESSWANRTIWANDKTRTGNRSLELVADSSNDTWRSELFSVTPSKNYLFNCNVNGTVVSGEWYLTLRWFKAYQSTDENWISEINAPIGTGNYMNWTQIRGFNFTAPPNAVAADILFRSTKNGTGTLYADDFDVNEIISPGSYIVRNDAKQLQISDWQANYSDLFVYGIVDEWLNNRRTEALNDFSTLIKTNCTPEGVNDSAWVQSGGEYQTYKAALIVICSKILNYSIPYNYTRILCQMQMPDGGFRTGYFLGNSSGIIPNPNATENVETTCWALYALNDPPQPWVPEFPNTVFLLILLSLSVVFVVKKKFAKIHVKEF